MDLLQKGDLFVIRVQVEGDDPNRLAICASYAATKGGRM